MKYKAVILLIITAIGFYSIGCDSPSETKATPVSAPNLLAPTDGATGISLSPMFKWETGAHKIQIDYNNTFNPPAVYNYEGLNGVTEFQLPPGVITEHNKTFFWRIGTVSGSSTTWSSSIFKFTTAP